MRHSQAEPKPSLGVEYAQVNFTPTLSAPRPPIFKYQQLRPQHDRVPLTIQTDALANLFTYV